MSDESKDDLGQARRRRLNGWKEIASYLDRDLSLRTAQRWEAQDGLPIYREGVKVFAYTDELDRWRQDRTTGPSTWIEPTPSAPQTARAFVSNVKMLRAFLAIAALTAIVVFIARRPHKLSLPTANNWGRLFVKATSEGKNPARIRLNEPADALAATRDGLKIYAASKHSRLLSIVHPGDGRVSTLTLPLDFGSLTMSPDGERLYIGSLAGGIAIVDTKTDKLVPPVFKTPGPVHDLVVTPDGKKLYMAMNRRGIWRALTTNGELRQLTDRICPVNLGLDPYGKTLYVSYQCGGPTGRSGHDATEIFSTDTEASLGTVTGPPMIGGVPSVSTDGRMVVLDGLHACLMPEYDHQGCPSVPSHVFHFLRSPDRQIVKTIGMPLGTELAGFIDPSRVLFLGNSLRVMDASQYVVTEKFEDKLESFSRLALLPVLRKAFVGVPERKEILVLDAENPVCSAPSEGLALSYAGDGTTNDAIGGAHLTSVGGVGFGPGKVGQAFALDGKSGYLVTPSTGFHRFGFRDSSFAAYVKLSSVDGEMTIFDRGLPDAVRFARLTKTQDRRFHFELATANGGSLNVFSTTTVVAERWYHVCVTKNDEELVLYVNGSPEDRKSLRLDAAPAASNDQYPLYFGASKDGQQFFHGKLDEILFYDRALRPDEVRHLYEMRESGVCRI